MGTARLREVDTVAALAFSPDGKVLASAATNSSGIHLWDTASGKEIRQLATDYVVSLAFAPDGKLLAAGDGQGKVHLHDLAGNGAVRRFELPVGKVIPFGPGRREIGGRKDQQEYPGIVCFVGFSADGKLLLAGSDINAFCAWEVVSGKEVRRSEGRHNRHDAMVFSADGKHAVFRPNHSIMDVLVGRLAVGAAGEIGKLRDLPGKQTVYTPAAYSPDGKSVVAEGEENVLYLSSTASLEVERKFRNSPQGLRSLAFTPDGKVLAGGGSGVVVLWDAKSGKELRSLEGQHTGSAALAFSADGKLLAIGGWDGAIRIRRIANGEDACPLPGHQAGVERVAFSADGKFLISASSDETVRFWAPDTGKEVRQVKVPRETSGVVAISRSGKLLASWSRDGAIRLWDGDSGKEVRKLDGPRQPANPGAAFSPDDAHLAIWDHDPVLRLMDTATGRELHRLGAPMQMVSAAFSPDGQTLATSDRGHTLRLWRTATGREFRTCPALTSEIWSVVFSPDGRTVLSRGNDSVVRLWEVATGKQRWELRHNADALVFSPDGKRIVTGIGTIFWLVDASTGKRLHEWRGHRRPIRSLAFSPDGKSLASGSWDTSVLVWDMTALPPIQVPAPGELTAGDLHRLWADLASVEATQGSSAINALAAAPKQALPLLSKQLRPALDPERVGRLITDLGSPRFAVRQKALAELVRLGEAAEAGLRRALAERPALEMRRRIEELLKDIDEKLPSSELLRALRAVEVLERIGGPEARKTLQTLAEGVAEARLTREAKATLKRLTPR
jgi:WD40 repeat protein